MDNHRSRQMRGLLGRYLAPRRHTALLIAIVALFMVRPLLGTGPAASAEFSIVIVILLLSALYAVQVDELMGERKRLVAQRKKQAIIGWALAVPAVVERVALIFVASRTLYVAGTMLWLALFIFITWRLLRSLLRAKDITSETISMSISVYLLMGFTWGLFYIVLYILQPQAFSLGTTPVPIGGELHIFPVLIYFSLATISTIGYGDITPLTLQTRYAAVAEGITGQFYIAILVARLVAMQMSQAASGRREKQVDDAEVRRLANQD